MLSLIVHKDFQSARRLPFCYLCGRDFVDGDLVDGDHVPPKAVFNPRDRTPTLKLKTHKKCNAALSIDDKKIAQLIALHRFDGPKSVRDQALQFASYPGGMQESPVDLHKCVESCRCLNEPHGLTDSENPPLLV